MKFGMLPQPVVLLQLMLDLLCTVIFKGENSSDMFSITMCEDALEVLNSTIKFQFEWHQYSFQVTGLQEN